MTGLRVRPFVTERNESWIFPEATQLCSITFRLQIHCLILFKYVLPHTLVASFLSCLQVSGRLSTRFTVLCIQTDSLGAIYKPLWLLLQKIPATTKQARNDQKFLVMSFFFFLNLILLYKLIRLSAQGQGISKRSADRLSSEACFFFFFFSFCFLRLCWLLAGLARASRDMPPDVICDPGFPRSPGGRVIMFSTGPGCVARRSGQHSN